jgi:hypothetical protein
LGINDDLSDKSENEKNVEEIVKEELKNEKEKQVKEPEQKIELKQKEVKNETKESKEFEVKRGKKVPNQMAKLFKTGHRMKSENDGNMYEVIGNGNTKKWKLVQE